MRPLRYLSRLLVVVLAVAGLLPAAALPAGAATATAAATVGPCPTSGLVVWLDTQGNGTAGSVYYHLELTNLSGRACWLAGYPGVSAVNLAGHQLGSAATRNKAVTPRRLTLGKGAKVSAVLQIVDAGNYPPAACRPTTAAGLRVYPPNQRAAKVVPFPFRACARPGPTFLSIEAVQGR